MTEIVPRPAADSAKRTAFALAYREHVGWLLQTVRRLGVAPTECEDVAHDVFATAWRRLETYDSSRAMRPWLFGIAFRTVSNLRATQSSSARYENQTPPHTVESSDRPDGLLERDQARQHVQAALEALPLEQRALFVGHDIDQTPIVQLADSLEIPLNTAYSRLRLARQRFQRVFDDLQEGRSRE